MSLGFRYFVFVRGPFATTMTPKNLSIILMECVTQSVRAAAWGGLRSQSPVVRFPAIIESFFGVIAIKTVLHLSIYPV